MLPGLLPSLGLFSTHTCLGQRLWGVTLGIGQEVVRESRGLAFRMGARCGGHKCPLGLIFCLSPCLSLHFSAPPSICHPVPPWGLALLALHSALWGASGSPAGTRWRSETWRWHSSTSGWGGVEGGAGAEGRAAGWKPGKPEPRASPRPGVGPAGSGRSVSQGCSARGRQALRTTA